MRFLAKLNNLGTTTDYCFIMKKKVMRNSIYMLFFFSLFSPLYIHSQVFWTEDFTNNCPNNCAAASFSGVNGAWTVTNTGTNGSDNNPWYVSAAENGSAVDSCSTLNGTDDCLHIGSNATVFGDTGAAFLNTGLFGLYDIVTDLRAESPIINCTGQTNITLSFNYIEDGDGTNDNATLWYFDGTTWTQLIDLAKTTPCSSNTSTWTNYSQTLPASADNNPLVQIGFRWVNNDDAVGEDPSIAVDSLTLSVAPASTDSIFTGVIAGGPFCSCSTVNVPFTSVGTFTAGNIYTAQLSDASGTFFAPVTIGTLASTANNGTISCTIPCNTPTGLGYLIRVISSNPSVIGTDNGVNIDITTIVAPSVSISAIVAGSICTDPSVTFNATLTNGGSTPSFQWQLNGVNVGSNSSSFATSAVLNDNDTISITVTTIAPCTFPIAFADTIISCATITTGAIAGSPFCACASVNVPFTSTGIFFGGNIYTAQISDALGSFATPVNIGTLASSANNGTISCTIPCGIVTGAGYLIRVVSSGPNVTGSDNGVNITINTAVTPSVSITATISGSICTDTALFTAIPVNGGTAPSYQWQINGVTVGTDSVILNPQTVLSAGDTVSVMLISNAACATTDTVQTDTVIICNSISTGTITGSPFCGCDSLNVPFVSAGIFGAGNVYTAQLSDSSGSFATPVDIGTLVSSANNGTISSMIPCTVLTGTIYLIRILSSNPSDTAVAGIDTLTINPVVVPSVSMNTTATTTLCIDTAVTFTAIPVNGGTAPTYQWQKNGVNIGTDSSIYTTSGAFMIGDVITVTMVSNAACPVPDTVQAFTIIDCPQIEISNVFTPNGDGINDLFRVNLSGNALQNFKIDIYDRWGLLMFTSTSINNKWDGRTTAGLKVVEGTYFYIVELNGTQYKGHVMVLY